MKIAPGTTLAELVEHTVNRGERAVLAELAAPAYLVIYPWEDTGTGLFDTCTMMNDEDTHDAASETLLDHGGPDPLAAAKRETSKARASVLNMRNAEAFLLPLLKSERNPFAQLITLGRAGNNDVILNSPSVSKVHAWFLNGGPTGWFLQDNNSTNGTTHNNEPAVAKENLPLRFGDTVSFGEVHTVFADPSGVLHLAQRNR